MYDSLIIPHNTSRVETCCSFLKGVRPTHTISAARSAESGTRLLLTGSSDSPTIDLVRLLVDRGTITRVDLKGWSPLRMAVEKGMEDAVVLLIENGKDPDNY
ncbi:hypothetical protein VTI74DRAFT_7172 [Chaetomium olivicolor]